MSFFFFLSSVVLTSGVTGGGGGRQRRVQECPPDVFFIGELLADLREKAGKEEGEKKKGKWREKERQF